MSLIRLNKRQQEWLRKASVAQRNAWLAKGPVEVGNYLDTSEATPKDLFGAHIRGVRVGDLGVDEKAVMEEGEKALEKIRQGAQEPVDEEALGIATVNQSG